MQLIDVLEARSDAIGIVESSSGITSEYSPAIDSWSLIVDGGMYPITKSAMDQLLNLLRIPIKYIERCVAENGAFLAKSSIDYWLSKVGSLSFLTEEKPGVAEVPVITQVFSGKGLYLPGVKVNDLIIDYLGGDCDVHSFVMEDGIFNAVYLTNQTVVIDEQEYRLGVRVLYSDCFSVTPRFDGVLLQVENGALLGFPTLGRKFRVASNTIPQVIDQIQDFLDLSLEGLKTKLIPSLQTWGEDHRNLQLVESDKWVSRLCNDLRLSQKVKRELLENCTVTPNHLPLELVLNVCAYTAGETEHIDLGTARDIQIACSRYVTDNNFKG